MGYGEAFERFLLNRSAINCSANLLARLEPGMRILDCGCGPGAISLELGQAVQPGELQGLDIEQSQIEKARLRAALAGCDNAYFQVGQATDLPFENDSFDAVHCHALVMHVPNTPVLMAELKRVLKPEGLLFARDMIGSSTFFHSSLHSFEDMMKMFLALIDANGGYAEMGKELKGVFLEAGFSNILLANTSFECYSTPDELLFANTFIDEWFFAPETKKAAINHGLTTEEQLQRWQNNLQECKNSTDSLFSLAWGECLARKS